MIVTFALQGESGPTQALKRAAITVESVRKHLPNAKIIQMANEDYPAVKGVDEVVRRKNDGDFIIWAFNSLIDIVSRGEDVLQIATDIVINGDISDVFDNDFDIAACRYPLKDRADGAFCGDVNFIKPSGLTFWQAVLDYYKNTPAIQDGWEGGQTAFLEVSKNPEFFIKELDYDTYCWTPWTSQIIPDNVKIAHFRGWRKAFMETSYKMKIPTVIVCLDDYSEKSSEYVRVLHDMVNRNLGQYFPYEFIFLTTKKEKFDGIRTAPLGEYINKNYTDLIPIGTRVIELDINNCIVCGLDDIAAYIGQPISTKDNSVKVWFSGARDAIASFEEVFPNYFHEYHTGMEDIPKDARIISFKKGISPHEIRGSWVEHIWKVGGGSIIEFDIVGNASDELVTANVQSSLQLPYVNIEALQDENQHVLCIIGGGPSLADNIEEVRTRANSGAIIWALNNSYKFLVDNGIQPHAQVMLDAREKNTPFVPETNVAALLYASTCHSKVFEKAAQSGSDIMIWHPMIKGMTDILGDKDAVIIGCGNSVGLKAMGLAMVMGFRDVHLYGYDSSYRGDANHAYSQPLNNGENVMEVQVNGRKFKTAAWMALQAEEFKDTCKDLIENHNMKFTIHGDGLLPYVASLLYTQEQAA